MYVTAILPLLIRVSVSRGAQSGSFDWGLHMSVGGNLDRAF